MINADAPEHWWPAGHVLAAQEALAMAILSVRVYRADGRSEAPGTDFSQHLERGGLVKKTLLYTGTTSLEE